MKKIIRKILIKIIGKINMTDLIDVNLLVKKINQDKINKCNKQVVKKTKATFYEEAKVYNLQKNINKIKIGENTHIRGELLVFANGGEIFIGDNCYIGQGSFIWSGESIRIGNSVLISHDCNIIDSDSHEIDYKERERAYIELLKEGFPKKKNNIKTKPINIGDNAWISFGVTILKGVTIGKGAIVGAGAVVTKDVKPFTLVAGNPAEEIKKYER